jgi:hypothetical protein
MNVLAGIDAKFDIHAIAARFTAAIEQADVAALRAILTPGATAWFNYRGPEGATLSAEDAIANIIAMRRHVREFHYLSATRTPTETGYFQLSRVRCVTVRGTVLDTPVALDADVDPEGRIAGYREWIDSAHLAPFLAEMQEGQDR